MEWNESEGAVNRTYNGLGKRTLGILQFDTTKNRFLAAGDEFQVKFWDMDNVNLLIAIDAEGGLPVMPTEGYIHDVQSHISRLLLKLKQHLPLISSRLLLVYDLTRKEIC